MSELIEAGLLPTITLKSGRRLVSPHDIDRLGSLPSTSRGAAIGNPA
jgi:hypothetical protein